MLSGAIQRQLVVDEGPASQGDSTWTARKAIEIATNACRTGIAQINGDGHP